MKDDLFPNFDESIAESEEGSQCAYEQKILKLIYKALYEDRDFRWDRREAGDDFGLDWFNDARDIPMVLFAKRKITVNPIHIVRTAGFTKTDLYTEFHFVADRLNPGTLAAMFFPVVRSGQFVIHNVGSLELIPGAHVMIRRGRKAGQVLRVEPVASFLKALAVQHGK